jgi:glucoamylase
MEIAEAIYQRNPNAPKLVAQYYWPLILADLNYVGQYWNTSSYDPWEEVNGNSFFSTTAQYRALVSGSLWAERLNQTCKPCEQAPEIACFLKNNFWNESGNYLLANINANQVNRSQIGTDPLLGSIHAFDINATCDATSMQPCNSRVLATHKVVVDSFRNLYPINDNATAPSAVAVGRYPEDTYYGGNPW